MNNEKLLELVVLKEYIINVEMCYLEESRGKWMQNDGTTKDISLMDESFIKNCIKLIERDIQKLNSLPEEIQNELLPLAYNKFKQLKKEYLSRI